MVSPPGSPGVRRRMRRSTDGLARGGGAATSASPSASSSRERGAGGKVDFRAVARRHGKSPAQWALYGIHGFGVFLAGFTTLWLSSRAHFEYVHPADQPPLPKMLVAAIPFFFLLMLVEMAHSWWVRGEWGSIYRLNDSLTSIFTGSYQQNTQLAFFRSLGLVPYAFVRSRTALTGEDFTPLQWVACFVAVEYGYYWVHRLAHEWNVMWAGHIVHHGGQDYNLATALRQSWLQSFYSWMFYLPFAPFFPCRLFVWHSQFSLLYQYWIHTKAIDRLPAFVELIFNTPSHHRVHHGRQAKYIDKNYGGTLIIFDRLFGTFQAEEEEVVYGVTTDLCSSWNTLFLQHSQFIEIWQTFQAMVSGRVERPAGMSSARWALECARVWIDRGPGFNYEVLKPEQVANPPPDVTPATEVKYDPQMPNAAMQAYGFVHGALVIAGTFGLIIAVEDPHMTSVHRVGIWAYLALGMWAIGALFEHRPYALALETARLVITAAVPLILASAGTAIPGGPAGLPAILGVAALSAGVLHTKYTVEQDH